MLPETKIMKKKQQYTFKHLQSDGIGLSAVFLLHDLDLLFKVKTKFYFLGNSQAMRKHLMTLSTWRFNKLSFSKVEMMTKLFLQICLHLYGIRRRVALVYYSRRISWSANKVNTQQLYTYL